MKYFAFIIVSLISIGHISATSLYLLPDNPISSEYKPLIHKYMHPVFSQNWRLFAPEPATSSLQFWYRCKKKSEWSQYRDPISSLIHRHRENRFTHLGKTIYVYQGLTRNLINNFVRYRERTKCEHDCLESFSTHKSYLLAKKFTSDLCTKEFSSSTLAQFKVVKVFSTDFSKRNETKPFRRIENINFNAFLIEN